MLDTEKMKEECHEKATAYLHPDKKGKGYVCPICKSGTGANGTGMTTKDKIHFTCHACRQISNNDIIDIIAITNGKEDADYIDKLKLACDKLYVPQYKKDEPTPKRTDSPKRIENKTTITPKQQKDFKKFYATCREELKASAEGKAYLEKRGISLYTALKYNIGYCENWVHPNFEGKEWKPKPTKRLIIATSNNSYIARDIRADIPENEKQYAKSKAGNVHLFNVPALFQRDKPVLYSDGGEGVPIRVRHSLFYVRKITHIKNKLCLTSKGMPNGELAILKNIVNMFRFASLLAGEDLRHAVGIPLITVY